MKRILFLSAIAAMMSCWELHAQVTSIKYGIYQACPVIENPSTRVVLCPEAGGRVLEYSLDGVNALYLSQYEQTGDAQFEGEGKFTAGRFDIGPEKVAPRRDESFRGSWDFKITGPRSVQLIGPLEQSTGVQLIRDFQLDPKSSRLHCTQTIKNFSDETVQYCHWSRTFGNQAGIVLIPLQGFPRFKNRYVRLDPGGLNLAPKDANIRMRDGFLELLGPPEFPKLGMDSYAGWLAHQQPTGILFIKQYPTYPGRKYGDVAGYTLSTWTPKTGHTVELEPIGPAETLKPGESSSFTEIWSLHKNPYPNAGEDFDLIRLKRIHDALPATDLEGPQ